MKWLRECAILRTVSTLITGGAALPSRSNDTSHAGDGVIVAGPGKNVIQFPDGTFVRFPRALSTKTSAQGTSTRLPDGTTIEARTDVTNGVEMWRAKNNIDSVCRVLPLPYFASLGCSAPGSPADAINKAHYQKKRIKALYDQCKGATYCSYYTYTVAA